MTKLVSVLPESVVLRRHILRTKTFVLKVAEKYYMYNVKLQNLAAVGSEQLSMCVRSEAVLHTFSC